MKRSLPMIALALSACVAGEPERAPVEDVAPVTSLVESEASRARALTLLPAENEWRRRVIYFTVLDRFENGDPTNDRASGIARCNDANDIRAFQGGDLTGLTDRLSYIEDLGATAIWSTPLYKQIQGNAGANCGYTGYWADFSEPYQLEVEPRFGTPGELDTLLTRMHQRGMHFILDAVVNHTGYGATLTRQRPTWFNDARTCAQQGSIDIYCPLAGLPDLDHRVTQVRDYMVDVHAAWLQRFAIDGIRMDTVKHVEPEYFETRWLPEMRLLNPSLYMVGELLNEGSLDPFEPYLRAGFDGLFNFPLRRALIDTFARGGSVDVAAGRMAETIGRFGQDRAAFMVNLLDNHDVPRFLEEIPRNIGADVTQRRYHLALSALLTLPGIPQLYYGNEIGMYGGGDPDNRRPMPDWAFDEMGRTGTNRTGFLARPGETHALVKDLLRLRREHEALELGRYDELWRQNGASNSNAWAYMRSTQDSNVLVAINNGYLPTLTLPLQVGGWLPDGTVVQDVLGRAGMADVTVQGGRLNLVIPARSAVILVPLTEQAPAGMVDVDLQVRADTSYGQSVYLTGDAASLGRWDLNMARAMTPSDCVGTSCTWSTRVTLPADADVAFKFVKIDTNLGVSWERGENRTLRVPTTSSSYINQRFRR